MLVPGNNGCKELLRKRRALGDVYLEDVEQIGSTVADLPAPGSTAIFLG